GLAHRRATAARRTGGEPYRARGLPAGRAGRDARARRSHAPYPPAGQAREDRLNHLSRVCKPARAQASVLRRCKMARDVQAVWEGLNERQRSYLEALYECDQATEINRRVRASEWRWVMYGPVAPPSPLYTALHTAGLIDPGTGATWQALETRGLLMTRTRREELGEFLEVQITALGRKVVRA